MAKTKFKEVAPGVLVQPDLKISEGAAKYFAPLVGRKITAVQLQSDPSGSFDPEIVLLFDDESYAFVLRDPEGNGPGWIDIQPPDA